MLLIASTSKQVVHTVCVDAYGQVYTQFVSVYRDYGRTDVHTVGKTIDIAGQVNEQLFSHVNCSMNCASLALAGTDLHPASFV